MSSIEKTKKMTVRLQPLDTGLHFDIAQSSVEARKEGSSLIFSGLLGLVFLFFVGLGAYGHLQSLLKYSTPIAFAGYDRLKVASEALIQKDFDRAERWFMGAKDAFRQLDDQIRFLPRTDSLLGSNSFTHSGQQLLMSAELASELGAQLTRLMERAYEIPSLIVRQNLNLTQQKATDELLQIKQDLFEVRQKTHQIQESITSLNPSFLPGSIQKNIEDVQFYVGQFSSAIHVIDRHFDTILDLMGDETPHRYLVLFQNTRERRATGGFIGSYALIDVNDGRVTKLDLKDVYETDGQLTEKVEPPKGIDLVADQFYLRDANYEPDFEQSAKKIMWFLEKSNGPSVDTVVAIDQVVVEELLRLVGSIENIGLPMDLTADNFTEIVSFYTEAKLSESDTPKAFLFEIASLIKDKILKDHLKVASVQPWLDLAEKGHIQVFSNYRSIQTLSSRLGVSGKQVLPQEGVDYLSVISTSVGGNKSDYFTRSTLRHDTEFKKDGSMIDHLNLEKVHEWSEEDFSVWKRLHRYFQPKKVSLKTLRFIHGEGKNKDYVRVFVPKGSELIGAEGLNRDDVLVEETAHYTVFSFLSVTKNKQKSNYQLSYRLPFSLSKKSLYKLIVQRQAAASDVELIKTLKTPSGIRVVKTHPEGDRTAFDLNPIYQESLDKNQIFVASFSDETISNVDELLGK